MTTTPSAGELEKVKGTTLSGVPFEAIEYEPQMYSVWAMDTGDHRGEFIGRLLDEDGIVKVQPTGHLHWELFGAGPMARMNATEWLLEVRR